MAGQGGSTGRTEVELPAEVIELIEGIAAREGVTVEVLFARAFGIEPVSIDAKAARRFREIEAAADIERGSVIDSLIDCAKQWWPTDDAGMLQSWILDGWAISKPATVKRNLRKLQVKWEAEDAAEDAAADALKTPEERAADEAEAVEIMERIVAEERGRNERAREIQREGASMRLMLDAELIEAAERYFPGTPYGSVSGFVEAAIRKAVAGTNVATA